MTYNIFEEEINIVSTVADSLRLELNLSHEALEWARKVRFPELVAERQDTREEVCYLEALREAYRADQARGWDFDPEYDI